MAQIKGIQENKEAFAVIRGHKNSLKISAKNDAVIEGAVNLIETLEDINILDDCIGDLLSLLTAAGCVITIVSSDKVEEVLL